MADENLTPGLEPEETPEVSTADAPADADAGPAEDDSIVAKVVDTAEDAVEGVVERAKDFAEDVVERVKDVAEDIAEKAGDVREAAVERAREIAEDVAEATEGAREAAGERGRELAETIVDRAVSAAGTVAGAVAGAAGAVADVVRGEPGSRERLGYTGEGLGRTVTLAELQEMERETDAERRGLTDQDLSELYERSMSDVTEHQVVTGRVVNITEKEIVVDFGFKSDGVVPKNEFDRDLEVGEEIEVYLDRLEDRRGQPVISKTKADDYNRWSKIMDAFENGTVLEGEVVKRIKGGMIVNLLGAEAFLPGSQVDVRPVRDFDTYLGRVMEFKVVKVNPANGNVVVSHKALIEKDLQAQRQQILDTLEVGQVLEGVVKNIVNFGAFVDLGGVDGLLHITDLSWGRVSHPSEVLEVEQKLQVVVLDYDRERQRISLGYKQLLPHPWETVAAKFVEGQEVEGRVVSITDYGAFVEIDRGIEGLVHISEMSWTEHVKHPTQKVQLGQLVQVKILRIDHDEKKISLGMKQLEPDPWADILARYPVGTVTNGKVRNLTTFGAFVELEAGVDGLVHVSDLSWTKRVKHPSEVVRKGQDLKVIVLDIDVAQRRISLGHKQVETDPWQQYETAYAPGTDVEAKVVDVNEGGVVVELPLEAEGFVPAAQLERSGRPSESYHLGDSLTLRVVRLDREERQVILSEVEKKRQAERTEREAARGEKTKALKEERKQVEQYKQASGGAATLGELSGLAALRDQLADEEAAPEASVEAPAEVQTADAADEPPAAEEAPAPKKRSRKKAEAAADDAPPEGAAPSDAAEEARTDASPEPEA
jgi:small subunit ribosomal protein S1